MININYIIFNKYLKTNNQKRLELTRISLINYDLLNKRSCQIIGLSLFFKIEESPGSVKTQCQLITGEGDFRDSATENKPPYQGKGETAR